jgi:anti-sigma B factor antagonist
VTATRHTERPDAAPVPFGVAVSVHGTTTMIALRGEWDLAQAPRMRGAISDALQRSSECVVLDLSRLSFIDSTGVRGVVELHKRCEQQNVHLVIVPGPRAVQRVFALLGLTEILPFGPGRAGSLSSPRATPTAEQFSRRRR